MTLASNEEFVRQCFDVFDQDKNGVITAQEFVVGGGYLNADAVYIDDLSISPRR